MSSTTAVERRRPKSFADRRADLEAETSNKEMPWWRHKLLLVQLWTGAYMLDRWEAVAIFVTPIAMFGAFYYFYARG